MILPNFFIVGAAKSGTTTLYNFLLEHPEVFMPSDELYKEPCFFSQYGNLSLNDYAKIYEKSNTQKLIGDASATYLADEKSANYIHCFKSDAKIIIIIRNPIKRAVSLYNWMVQEGYEYARNFVVALKLEKKRNKLNKKLGMVEKKINYMYFSSGLYYKQVKQYYDLFGKQNVLVLLFSDLISKPQNTFNITCDFLNINHFAYTVPENKQNKSKQVIHPLFQFLIRKINNRLILPIRRRIIKNETKQKQDFLLSLFQINKKNKEIDENILNNLKNKYSNDIKLLSNLINKDLSEWLK